MNLRTNDYVFCEQTTKIGMHEFKLFHSIDVIHFFFTFQFAFKAVRGNGYRGDIAIDDVYIEHGTCY
jgi:hypothetical protein